MGIPHLEGLIEGLDDLEMVRVCLEDRLADVRLRNGFPDVPPRKILTSGCTGGVSFGKYLDQIEQFRGDEDQSRPGIAAADVRVAAGALRPISSVPPIGRRAHVNLCRA